MGSKNRIAKYLLPIMLENRGSRTWVEPFVGGANMIDKVGGKRIGADNNEYLIALLQKMSKEDFEAPKINEALYNEIKSNKNNFEKWLVGYAGTQLSFGAIWFVGYRRDKKGIRDYCNEARSNVNKQALNLKGISFVNCSYDELEIPPNSLIYCDPPYEGTAEYKVRGLSHTKFWQWCRQKTKEGHQVYISEYNAPEDFICIFSKEIKQVMNNTTSKTQKPIEKLFIYNDLW